jgi:opacity protein-like surface antigen
MSKVRTLLLSLALIAIASTSQAEDLFFYGSVRGAAAFASSTLYAYQEEVGEGGVDTGYEVGASVGVQFIEYIRWDILDYSYIGGVTGDESSTVPTSAGLSVVFDGSIHSLETSFRFGDFRPSTRFHPYLSVGVGGARTNLGINGVTDSYWGLSTGVGAGLEFDLSKHVSIGLVYRFRYIAFDTEFPAMSINVPGQFQPYKLQSAEANLQMHTVGLAILFR